MSPREVDLITVDREFGAGGSDFAHRLGELLGWPVLDREVTRRVAARLQLPEAAIARLDERPPSFLDRVATAPGILFSYTSDFPPTAAVPPHDEIAAAATAVLEDAGRSPPIIIVGHGSQCLFRQQPHALHVRITAPLEARVQRIAASEGEAPDLAAELVRRVDRDRRRYVTRYFGFRVDDPSLYDLQFNTHRIAVEDAAAVVADLVARWKFPNTLGHASFHRRNS